jgi:predicted Co/Zn/Cd cation transporter (cation efflux family)
MNYAIISYIIVSTILCCLQLITDVFTPRYLYNKLKLNWFGAWFLSVPVMILNGALFVVLVVVAILQLIVWLFTVGHKD